MPIRRLFFSVLALLALLSLLGCGGGSDVLPSGQVQGRVFLSQTKSITTIDTGNGAAGAEIRLLGTSLNTVADAEGFFFLPQVPAGQHTLLIMADGYQSVTFTITVVAGQTFDISTSAPTPVTRTWTVLIFMNANNDLEQFALLNMNQLESVSKSEKVDVVVQMARSDAYDTSDGDWHGTRRYLVQHDTKPDTINSLLLQDMGRIDMGQPATLREFIAWGQRTFPADHYLVIAWNHGSGVLPFTYGGPVIRAISFDNTFGSYIRTIDMDDALAAFPPVDNIAFDTCETQMVEIAYQIRENCRYVIASQGDTPGTGYPYHVWLAALNANPNMAPRELAITMARTMRDHYSLFPGIAQSVVDTMQLEGLATAVDTFAQALIAVAGTEAAALSAARTGADHYATRDYRDLHRFATLVKSSVSDPALRTAADNVITALQRAVIANYSGYDHPHIGGTSIYFPTKSIFQQKAALYRPLDFSQRTRWPDWLAAQP